MRKLIPSRGSVRETLLLLLGSLLTCLLLLALFLGGELLCRAFSDISFRGNSASLFVADAYGSSKGNARNATNISFGVEVHTDEFGFRVPGGGTGGGPADPEHSLLILGDSVGFGAGVGDDRTVAGLLRAQNPALRLYNSSVIGYFTHDYRNVVEHFPWAEEGIDRVALIFCLNDVSAASAQRIDAHLEAARNEPGPGATRRQPEPSPAAEGGLVGALRGIGLIGRLNEYLRTRSKLYLLTISILADPRPRQWEPVRRLYGPDNELGFEESMRPLAEMARMFTEHGVEFRVVVLPFSPQLRGDDPALWAPQSRLAEYFQEHGIDYIDARTDFAEHGADADDLFLPFDPMHLSQEGHRVVAGIIARSFDLTG